MLDCTAQEMKRATTVLVQVKVAPSIKEEFSQKYTEATGARPQGEAFICEKRRDGRKANYEVWFAADETVAKNLAMLGYSVQPFLKGEFTHMVDDERLFWKLVRNGYRIGQVRQAPAAMEMATA
jgi:hypothetical protein